MPIEVVSGDIFEDDADVLVIPVNCVGVMGAGLAKVAKQKWPEMYTRYRNACHNGRIKIGHGNITEYPQRENPEIIACLPTKIHWKNPSELEYVRYGLAWLRYDLWYNGPKKASIAIPALGCGLGGLDFTDVLPLIVDAFKGTDYDVRVYRPR